MTLTLFVQQENKNTSFMFCFFFKWKNNPPEVKKKKKERKANVIQMCYKQRRHKVFDVTLSVLYFTRLNKNWLDKL